MPGSRTARVRSRPARPTLAAQPGSPRPGRSVRRALPRRQPLAPVGWAWPASRRTRSRSRRRSRMRRDREGVDGFVSARPDPAATGGAAGAGPLFARAPSRTRERRSLLASHARAQARNGRTRRRATGSRTRAACCSVSLEAESGQSRCAESGLSVWSGISPVRPAAPAHASAASRQRLSQIGECNPVSLVPERPETWLPKAR